MLLSEFDELCETTNTSLDGLTRFSRDEQQNLSQVIWVGGSCSAGSIDRVMIFLSHQNPVQGFDHDGERSGNFQTNERQIGLDNER